MTATGVKPEDHAPRQKAQTIKVLLKLAIAIAAIAAWTWFAYFRFDPNVLLGFTDVRTTGQLGKWLAADRRRTKTPFFVMGSQFLHYEVESILVTKSSEQWESNNRFPEPDWVFGFSGPSIIVLKSGERFICNDLVLRYSGEDDAIVVTQYSAFNEAHQAFKPGPGSRPNIAEGKWE